MDHYWRIGSDDLPIPFACIVIARLVWLTLLSVSLAYALKKVEYKCEFGLYSLPIYMIISIFFFIISIISGIIIIRVGSTGRILETEARSSMPCLLKTHMVILFLEGVCAVYGMVVFVMHYNMSCYGENAKVVLALIAAVVISQFAEFLPLICCCCTVQSRPVDKDAITGHLSDIESSGEPRHIIAVNEVTDDARQAWMQRLQRLINCLRCCCCNLLGGNRVVQDDLEGAAITLSNFFHHDGFLDIVPGDVLAGLLLVRWQRCSLEKALKQNPLVSAELGSSDSTDPSKAYSVKSNSAKILLAEAHGTQLNPESPRISRGRFRLIGNDHVEGELRMKVAAHAKIERRELEQSSFTDRQLIEDMSDLMPYSLAVYSVFLALLHPCTFSCRMCISGVSHCGKHSKDDIIGDDYGLHKAAALHHLRDQDFLTTQLVHGNFDNHSQRSPYCIFADHSKRRVIVSIRGTMSIEDAVTDILCKTVEMTAAGATWGFDGKDKFAHEGFLRSANFICQELVNNGILEKVFAGMGSAAAANSNRDLDANDTKPSYELVIIGHSLGAALATLVAYLLRPKYPQLRCFAFAAPPCLDQATAVECEDFVTSVILGDDIVPALTYFSVCHLRERVLDALLRAKVNKFKILRSTQKDFDENTFMFKPGEEPDSEFKRSIEAFKAKIHSRHASDLTPQVAVSGKIIHLICVDKTQRGVSNCFSKSPIFKAFECSWESFLNIPVSINAVKHHWPDKYMQHLAELRTTWGIDK